ncbi:putative transporter svop-1 [Diabrotica virgifera virgifera]|uniref:Transporter svop-1 n=1 Tax=Diabrotica virgifera virgifera TaxID=50390 RepID=A0A6P7G2S1_DIAVI|nr:putative transporter svop-1 [Diabrotica virgifera virgifera]XP_050513627.1 putative transporter svop-1 [Diabrotica virgifera virgifera]XP_050513628.1 putative transporter svop-1 [Diabrotica virgifera virgifera]
MELQNKEKPTTDATTFEDAIAATKFGKYNIMLIVVIALPCVTQLLNTVELSYILPVAQCDLGLTLEDKGLINAIMFAGMISTGVYWGYLCDALGRKRIIVYGFLLSGFFAAVAALSTSKYVLLAAKFMSGAIINGPFSATTSHITEFHSSEYRGRVNMARGMFLSFGSLLLPILSWAILPRKMDIFLFGIVELHSWNIFLLVCALSTIFCGVVYIFIPESPKYLMSTGRNEQAMKVLQKIYSLNTGNAMEDFPVKKLVEEVENSAEKVNVVVALKKCFREMKYLLHKPYVNHLLLACFNVFSLLISVNTVKLWLPGIFQAISDYQNAHNGTSTNLCTMLEQMVPKETPTSENCTVDMNNLSVYINTFIVSLARIVAFAFSTVFIRMLGIKRLNIILCFATAALQFCIYFARDSATVTILSATGTAIGSVAENLLISLTLELFPTTLRTIALSIHLTSGRTGTLVGNIVFPYLLSSGCLPPFFWIGIFCVACGLFSFLYPSVEDKPLK